jgi:RNA polymerase sigma factor (sigma-70 family)
MTPDCELLRRYAESRSEEAFAELVRRHTDLVYCAALRQVNGDALLAQEVAQAVFTDLARKAAALSRRAALSGWLYSSTHFAAAKAVRTERRRQDREQKAYAMEQLIHTSAADPDWESLRPVLDHAMQELGDSDRDLILLRYFENRRLAEIGQGLGLTEEAVRKRAERALEKLRSLLARRGISTTASLVTVISANATASAPPTLAAALTKASLAHAAAWSGSKSALLKFMATTKVKTAIVGVIIVGMILPLALYRNAQGKIRAQNTALAQQASQIADLQGEVQRLQAIAAPEPPMAEPSRQLLRLRNEVATLRGQLEQVSHPAQVKRTTRNEMLASAPGSYREQQLGNVIYVAKDNSKEYAEDLHKLAPELSRENPKMMDVQNLRWALTEYADKHNGEFPPSLEDLAPYVYKGALPLAGTYKDRDPMAGTNDFEIVFGGSRNDLINVPLSKVALLRERRPWPTPRGKLARIYLMAGGPKIVVESDDNFQDWEAAHIVPPP